MKPLSSLILPPPRLSACDTRNLRWEVESLLHAYNHAFNLFVGFSKKENPLPVEDSGFTWRYDYGGSPWQPRYLIDLLIDLDRKLCALSSQIVCPSG
jgi:hypothetical protein